MGEASADTLLILAVAAAVLVAFGAIIARRSRARRHAKGPPADTLAFGSVTPAESANGVDLTHRVQPVPAPPTPFATRVQESYAAIAAVQAPLGASRDAPPQARIDYSNALAGIMPDTSYASRAIASLLGVEAHDEQVAAPVATPQAQSSYAAVAASAANGATLRPAEPPVPSRPSYGDEPVDVSPTASYAAIAVAAAASKG